MCIYKLVHDDDIVKYHLPHQFTGLYETKLLMRHNTSNLLNLEVSNP